MKKLVLFFGMIFFSISFLLGQKTHTVLVNDRNTAIDLTNEAISDIDNKDYTKAFNKLRKSIKIDSLYREAYLRIYHLYSKNQENAEETIGALKKGKRIFEEDDELYFYCGQIYRSIGDAEKAFYEYTKAIEYAKVNGEDFYLVPYYYLNRGNLYLFSNRYESAINDYNHLLKLDATSNSGLTNRGIAYHLMGDYKKACQDWNRAIENGFDKAKAYYRMYCKD